jgi:hypothetical protein
MPLRLTGSKQLQIYNLDWQPLRPFTLSYLTMGLLIIAAVAIGIWSIHDPRALAAICFILPTMQYVRFTPYTAPLLVMVLSERLARRHANGQMPLRGWLLDAGMRLRLQMVAGAILTLGVIGLVVTGMRDANAVARIALPSAAVDQMLTCGANGNVWNEYNWGGHPMWRADGRLLVGMEG